ncbi:MAG: SpoIID/LytB domain-containing protein [Chloroflexi bacterium]|nr:SpoIID/LytB domain-containing protein [Chloroflexota bacterium]
MQIQDERWRTGRFVNPRGRVIDQIGAADHLQPHHIRVYRVASGVIDEVDFYSYVINVLPNEWYGSWHAEALRAGAIAAKMYGWYRVYIAKYPGQGYDARDDTWDQVYKPNSAYPTTTAAVDFVNSVGIARADSAIFETQYHGGAYDASGQSSGRVSQWGTKYWADLGKDHLLMIHYYYDNSPNTNGQLAQTFAYTPNRSPLAPTHIEPANGALGISRAPTLRASAFSDPDVGDTHAQTWWEIRRARDNALMWDSGWQTATLTTTLVPIGILDDSTRYKWRARYLDSKGAWSEPAPTFAEFTTTFRALMPFVAR